MRIHSLYPLLQAADAKGRARFCEIHFSFSRMFSSDWYIPLGAKAEHARLK